MTQPENPAQPETQTKVETITTLSLFIGESFAEAFLTTTDKSLDKKSPQKSAEHFHRWYLGKEGLRGGLQRFIQQTGCEKIQKTSVASRFLEKIFSYRLGGSVATVVTKGFETWPALRQPLGSKTNTLSSAELVFPFEERCNANGVIEKEIADDAISSLIQDLRAKQAKRVCIHFINAKKNPHNQDRLKSALIAENFEVFIPSSESKSEDEVSRWRKNVLNASVSGTFEEVQAELNLALAPYLPEGKGADFISACGSVFDKEVEHRLSSLWGASFAWTEGLRKTSGEKFDVLYLGLDQFSLFYPGKTTEHWDSPWGRIDIPHVKNHLLALQPTSAIAVNSWGALDFGTTVGYEPGPMFMGRGQAPTLLDLWAQDMDGLKALEERRSVPGMQKFKNQIWALNKTSAEPFESEEKVQPALRELALQKLVMDIQVSAENRKIICLGTLAPLFFTQLKKRLPLLQMELRPETETASLLSQGSDHAL